ncbi:MAG: DUF3109 family protein, partial [Prevotellaceae bacterium]|nr:DUF3109 family protein [Prevotellaceae bacterium]
MLQIEDKVISLDLFEQRFACNLQRCLGACCVYGDSGAPLEKEEKVLLEKHIAKIKPYLTPRGAFAIEEKGATAIDADKELVTPLVGDHKECAYAYFSYKGICFCGIEKAYKNGDIPFNKPISCHLYPIRLKTFDNITALNYDQWSVCTSARDLGKKEKIPVFRFLKEPIIRKFGEKFYEAMEEAYKNYE